MTLRVEFFGGPKDGDARDVDHVVATLSFPTREETEGRPPVHRYEWRANAVPQGYYYAGVVKC